MFDSNDDLNPVYPQEVSLISSGETHKSLFGKLSNVVKNVRYLLKIIGTTDISHLGNGTVTRAITDLVANSPARHSANSSDKEFAVFKNVKVAYRVSGVLVGNANGSAVFGLVTIDSASETKCSIRTIIGIAGLPFSIDFSDNGNGTIDIVIGNVAKYGLYELLMYYWKG